MKGIVIIILSVILLGCGDTKAESVEEEKLKNAFALTSAEEDKTKAEIHVFIKDVGRGMKCKPLIIKPKDIPENKATCEPEKVEVKPIKIPEGATVFHYHIDFVNFYIDGKMGKNQSGSYKSKTMLRTGVSGYVSKDDLNGKEINQENLLELVNKKIRTTHEVKSLRVALAELYKDSRVRYRLENENLIEKAPSI